MNPLIQKVDSKAQFQRWQDEKKRSNDISDIIYDQHLFHLSIIRRLHQAGVNIVCSTDAGIGITVPGISIHKELQFYVEAGMSNYEALKTATVNPMLTHKVFGELGTVEKGKIANLILTQENPLDDLNALRSPEWVMVNGRKLDRESLQKFESAAKERNNFIVTALRYLEYLIIER
jgi:imidazolonepropionase-like amidohydrolase